MADVFQDQTVVITGGAQGLGLAMAEGFARSGAHLVIWDIDGAHLEEARSRLSAIGAPEPKFEMVDVSDPGAVRAAAQGVGVVDVLVNNAGVQFKESALDITPTDWARVLAVDLNGPFYCAQAIGRGMVERRRGAIVNIASCVVGFGIPARVPYAVSKAGLVQLTRTLAVEWAESNVRVNAVAPGYVLTGLLTRAFAEGYIQRPEIESKIAMRRLGRDEEIAEAVMFLASPQASYVTGQTLYVDGGYSIHKG